jgi:hypothetical protein
MELDRYISSKNAAQKEVNEDSAELDDDECD